MTIIPATNESEPIADTQVAVRNLRFDDKNPRIPGETFESEDDIIVHLINDFNVEELVQSIMSSGWIDYEPLIVEQGTNKVYEGNRRLAALLLMSDEGLRRRLKYELPKIADAHLAPVSVRVRYVSGPTAARRFIAFKHITGPLKWDAYAKAKYAADWLGEGEKIDVVSKMLGDSHNTVRRLVAGFNVLQQAQESGFDMEDRSKRRFAFSHLYTAVSRPAVRDFLGLDDNDDDVLRPNPVPRDRVQNLSQLMSWLYGQERNREPAVIISQNPNLNQLVRVIESAPARAMLMSNRNLERAYEEVEPPAYRFKDALVAASKQCETALGLSSHYDGEETLLAIVRNMATTVRNLRDAMTKVAQGPDDL